MLGCLDYLSLGGCALGWDSGLYISGGFGWPHGWFGLLGEWVAGVGFLGDWFRCLSGVGCNIAGMLTF